MKTQNCSINDHKKDLREEFKEMKKRILSLFLVTVMILSTVAISPVSVWAADNSFDISNYAGTSTFIVSTADDMMNFAAAVDSGKDFAGKEVVLAGNIDMSGKSWKGIGYNNGEWKHFCGTFDGKGYTISNLTASSGNSDRVGALFNSLAGAAVVKNFTLTGTVTLKRASAGNSNYYGSIAARVGGSDVYDDRGVTIQNVHSSVNFDGSHFEDVNKTNCGLFYVGGLVSYMNSGDMAKLTIDSCVYDGTISCNATAGGGNRPYYFGGLVGFTGHRNANSDRYLYIKNSVYAGSISLANANHVGALIGGISDYYGGSTTTKNIVEITDTIAIGTVSCSDSRASYNGELIGAFSKRYKQNNVVDHEGSGYSTLTMTNVYYIDVQVSDAKIGSVNSSATLNESNVVKTTIEEISALDASAFSANATFSYKAEDVYSYVPCPTGLMFGGKWVNSLIVGYEPADLLISTADELWAWAETVENGNTYANKVVALNNNIDLADLSNGKVWNSAGWGDSAGGAFAGTFNGNGYTIDLDTQTPTRYGEGGLFGTLADGAIVKNLKLVGQINITNKINAANGCHSFAGVASRVRGTVLLQNIHCSVNMTATVNVNYSGGLVGWIQNGQTTNLTIDSCVYDGMINCANQVNVLGGFVGHFGTSSASRSVTISNSVFAGTIMLNDCDHSTEVGGFVGYMISNNSKSVDLKLTNLVSVGKITFNTSAGKEWTVNSGNWGVFVGGFAASKSTDAPMKADSGNAYASINPVENVYYLPFKSPLGGNVGVLGAIPYETTSVKRMNSNCKVIDGDLTADDFTNSKFAFKESICVENFCLERFYPCPEGLVPAEGWLPSLHFVSGNANVLGAQIRCTGAGDQYSGIRFVGIFDADAVTGAATTDANFGLILISKAFYDAAEDKTTVAGLLTAGGYDVQATQVDDSIDGYYRVNAVVYEITADHYTDEIVAIAYVDGALVGDVVTRSIYDVATKCVADTNATAAQKTFCQAIIDTVGA